MLELKRIYWTRKALRLAMAAAVLWLLTSAVVALWQNAANVTARPQATSPTDILDHMFNGVLIATALPGLFVIVLTIMAVAICARDVRRRDPVRRFTRQQRREGMAGAGGQCEVAAGFAVAARALQSTVIISIPGPREGPPA